MVIFVCVKLSFIQKSNINDKKANLILPQVPMALSAQGPPLGQEVPAKEIYGCINSVFLNRSLT